MLNKLLSLPKQDSKYYVLDAVSIDREAEQALLFHHNGKLVILGFSYALFCFETIDTISEFTDNVFESIDDFHLIEVSESDALSCLRFYMETEVSASTVYLPEGVEKQFFIDSILGLINRFGAMIDEQEKVSFETDLNNAEIALREPVSKGDKDGFYESDHLIVPDELVDITTMPYLFSGREETLNMISYYQNFDENLSMVISKSSEAVAPNVDGNVIGDGASLDDIIKSQKGIRFIINGGFNHYRKNFYQWKADDFNVGDPVGLVKIRENLFEDYIDIKDYGFLTQENKGDYWKITNYEKLNRDSKYILGCTPLLINKGKAVPISVEDMIPVKEGEINPPSFLGHGMQIHPRTAVATMGRELIFIVIENNAAGTGGCTLQELQNLGLAMGFDYMLNLDGGGSSQFKFMTDNGFISNYVLPEDQNRVLGHSLIIFDESLK